MTTEYWSGEDNDVEPDDSDDALVAECASRCRNCTDCNQPVPCGGCTAGGICDAWCTCDRDSDARYEDGRDGDDVEW